MEQTALRPKPMPGQGPVGTHPSGTARRPHAAHRRGKRLTTLLLALFAGVVLVLAGVGLGSVGATVIGMSKLAELQRQANQETGRPGSAQSRLSDSALLPGAVKSGAGGGSSALAAMRTPGRATLGIEAVDAPRGPGALVIAVHVPGPGYTAGLVRGDVLLSLGGTRVATAADLGRAIADARPGAPVRVAVRHANGTRQQLTTIPGIVT